MGYPGDDHHWTAEWSWYKHNGSVVGYPGDSHHWTADAVYNEAMGRVPVEIVE